MKEFSPQLVEAQRLIRDEATVSGTAAKLVELEKQAPEDGNDEYWGMVWESFHAATDERGLMELFELPE